MKKIISVFITVCLAFSTLPGFTISVSAKTPDYLETTKDSVPLRNNYGEGNTIVARVVKKGSVLQVIDKKTKWVSPITPHVWYKVQNMSSSVLSNNSIGSYWVYEGNVTKHGHNMSQGFCQGLGCGHVDEYHLKESKTIQLRITQDNTASKTYPFAGATTVQKYSKGTPVTSVATYLNAANHIWYKLADGNFVYSGNVTPSTPAKDKSDSNNANNSQGGSSGTGSSGGGNGSSGGSSSAYIPSFTRPEPCTLHTWNSTGYCSNCGKEFEIKEEYVNASFKTSKANVTVHKKPYAKSEVVKTYSKADSEVPVTAKAKNAFGNTWYKTTNGWIYNVGDVSLKSISLSSTGYTFNDIKTDTVTPTVNMTPKNAAISSITWTSDYTNVATVDSNGKITPKGIGKSVITCTVKSKEGTTKTAKFNVVVPESATYENWTYNNYKFEYDLALECSAYSALAYPRYKYEVVNGKPLVYVTDDKPDTPKNLAKLLQENGFNYDISNNYYNKTTDNSPFVLASKWVKVNGTPTPVVYVIIEGTAGLKGWQGNMMISGTSYANMTTHDSFEKSANNIKTNLDNYIKQHGFKNTHVVITGHSRGAAAGNLLAQKLQNNLSSTTYKAVYAYLFATPNTTKSPQSSSNIFNICNTGDFVAYIPLSTSGWNFDKHGRIYCFDAQAVYKQDNAFKNYVNSEYKKSKYSRNTPDYKWCSDTPDELRNYVAGRWSSVSQYYAYNRNNTYANYDMEAYDYFMNGLAAAAGGQGSGVSEIGRHLLHNCAYNRISRFMVGNAAEKYVSAAAAFYDDHEMMTYHAALLARVYNSSNKAYIFSDEGSSGNGLVAMNTDEYEMLHDFFVQNENTLMLELNGWDVNDSSTWSGIRWNLDGNVTDIDISYMNLSGWLDVSDFSHLENLSCDGNNISMLALSGCSELVNLTCSSNDLGYIDVGECNNLANLNCSYNELTSLDVSNMVNLVNLNCVANHIGSLNLYGASTLSTVKCGSNELYGIDISTNTALSTFYCEDNNIIEADNTDLLNTLNSIESNGGSVEMGTQKYNNNFEFNANELEALTDFANSSLNLEKLGWDLDDPYSWQGVKWKICGDEYHITDIQLDNFDLEGTLNLPEVDYVENISITGSSLSAINLTGCSSLQSLNCFDSGIDDLNIGDCSNLADINCDNNYLKVEDVESSLSQIGLNTGLATYENQNIDADETEFNEHEKDALLGFLSTGNNYEALLWEANSPGSWDGIIWTNVDGEYRVNKIDFAGKNISGDLNMVGFDYLEDFNFSGTGIESVTLPNCITKIPESAFYGSKLNYIYIDEGVTNIENSAFAYCADLHTIALPESISRIADKAFYGSENLKSAVFLGNEPINVGDDAFSETSVEFKVYRFKDTSWSDESILLNKYDSTIIEGNCVTLLDEIQNLKPDDYYNESNSYSGDDIVVTLVLKSPINASCILSVYDDNGIMNDLQIKDVNMTNRIGRLTFEDVNVQYAGEEFCKVKAFLWDNTTSMRPIALSAEQLLFKSLSDEE